MLKVALGQFAVSKNWQENVQTCIALMQEAEQGGARLLVLPEGILARDIHDPDLNSKEAQPLDGPFVTELLNASKGASLTTIATIHVPAPNGLVYNTLIAIADGKLIAEYKKLHLYDAFTDKESTRVMPGNEVPPVIDVCGMKAGLMTCYDVRFPELARRLTLDGADFLILPAAWVRGPLKESHWEILVRARALENTVYVIAVDECGPRNIGCSMVVDPLGTVVAMAAEAPALVYAEIDPARIAYARRVLPVLENRRFAEPQLT